MDCEQSSQQKVNQKPPSVRRLKYDKLSLDEQKVQEKLAEAFYGKSQTGERIGNQMKFHENKKRQIIHGLKACLHKDQDICIIPFSDVAEGDMYFNPETGRVGCLTCFFVNQEAVIFEGYETKEILSHIKECRYEAKQQIYQSANFDIDMGIIEEQVSQEMEVLERIGKESGIKSYDQIVEIIQNHHEQNKSQQEN